jgi:hypothetical protein
VRVTAVFAGSALWWRMLSGAVGAVPSRLDWRTRLGVNRLSGVVVLGFGVAALFWRWMAGRERARGFGKHRRLPGAVDRPMVGSLRYWA